MTDVVVIGGGITGLVAARDLVAAGAAVTLVEPGRLGGKLRTSTFDGGVLDESADAFLARVADGVDLCHELGLDGDLVSPSSRRAFVWSRGELRLLPEAQLLGVPTDLDELAASDLLTDAGLEAARRDLTGPMVAPDGDVAIGAFVRQRLGDEVVDRLVDPLVGGINAGDSDVLSMAATTPQLDAAARSGAASLIEACAAQRAAVADPDAPVFFAPRGGMGSLAEAVATDASGRGLAVVSSVAVGLDRERAAWRVSIEGGRALRADGVVIATPARAAAGLVRPHATRAAMLLDDIPYASVALISLAVERAGVEHDLVGSGFLVPRVEGRTVTACSWASSKWSHLGGEGRVWLRASIGRDGDDRALALGDDALVAAAVADLADLMALRGPVMESRVSRWPASFPQYRPGHLERIDVVEADIAAVTPTLVVAGAALRGLGVPACIRQGRDAARRVVGGLSGAS